MTSVPCASYPRQQLSKVIRTSSRLSTGSARCHLAASSGLRDLWGQQAAWCCMQREMQLPYVQTNSEENITTSLRYACTDAKAPENMFFEQSAVLWSHSSDQVSSALRNSPAEVARGCVGSIAVSSAREAAVLGHFNARPRSRQSPADTARDQVVFARADEVYLYDCLGA